jgi:hypothetical protein
LVVLFAVLAITLGDSGSLEVRYENYILKIQNIGDSPVEILGLAIIDRSDCEVIDLLSASTTLKVGDARGLMTTCDAVRTTITTIDGPTTYYLKSWQPLS